MQMPKLISSEEIDFVLQVKSTTHRYKIFRAEKHIPAVWKVAENLMNKCKFKHLRCEREKRKNMKTEGDPSGEAVKKLGIRKCVWEYEWKWLSSESAKWHSSLPHQEREKLVPAPSEMTYMPLLCLLLFQPNSHLIKP